MFSRSFARKMCCYVLVLLVVPMVFGQLEKIDYPCDPGNVGDSTCTLQCAYYQQYFGAAVCGSDSACYCKLKVRVNPNIRQEMVVDVCTLSDDRDAKCNSKCLTIPIFKAGYCGTDFKCYCLRK